MDVCIEREKITKIGIDDIDVIVGLHEEYLNFGEDIKPHYDAIVGNPDNVALKHTLGGEITGIDIYTKGIALSGTHDYLIWLISRMTEGKCVYTADAVLVRREFRSLGVAGKLWAASLAELKRHGAQRILYELWVHPDGHVPARKVLDEFESKTLIGRFEDFYFDFHHYGYYCPICGANCVCAAEVYVADIPGIGGAPE